MESLYILIPLSLLLMGLAIGVFVRMSQGGQFEDTEGPGWRVLMDDDSTVATRLDVPLDVPHSDRSKGVDQDQ